MKRVYVLFLFILTALLLNGQKTYFKKVTRYPAGTLNPDFDFVSISSAGTSKSASKSKFGVPNNLTKQFLSKNTVYSEKIIRKDGIPIYIEKETDKTKSGESTDYEVRFFRFLEDNRVVTETSRPKEQFKITDIITDDNGITHIKTIQQYKGINIYGSESTLHLSNEKERYLGSFNNLDNSALMTTPEVSSREAVTKVSRDLRQRTVLKELNLQEKKILNYDSPISNLVIYDKGGRNYVLAWEITVRPNFIEVWKYFTDAVTGEIIHFFNATCSDGPTTATAIDLNNVSRTIDTYLENGTYYLLNLSEYMFNPAKEEGMVLTLDANNTSTSDLDYRYVTSQNNTWTNKSAVSAHYNATLTYKYFWQTHRHNSVNGTGGNILSLINVAEDDGSSMENAFWNGQAVFYGNGGKYFKPLAGALDVTAHELGHGVVSNTANLEYYGQAGAINETYADIFGSMVDRDDWLIGEDITRTTFSPSGALRNMADPHNLGSSGDEYWQPNHVSEMYRGSEDNGGVHINSGIGNHAYYRYATAVTKDKAEKVFFHALDKYLTKTSTFLDFRIAVIQSAVDLFGEGTVEVTEAEKAFDAVGIYEEEKVDKTRDYMVNPGSEFILFYNTDNSFSTTLALFDGTNYQSLSTTTAKNNASVSDDGKEAVFVSSDSKIRYISLDPLEPERIISDQAFWENVTISKDGNRLAAISTEVDTSIYVWDFTSRKWGKFKLYNPTTSQFNTDAGGVLYADAIEFDITGEYLIYDACNVLSSNVTEDIYYWDIGIINVWDNSKKTFGDGSIFKLYGSLPENVSIGNPVFSKNSSSIIAFDYIDSSAEEYAILGVNLNTGETKKITDNAALGFPSFSKNDDKIAFSALTTNDKEAVGLINLAPDKISGSGSAYLLFSNAKWPVYFASGERKLGLPPVSDFTVDFKTGGVPLQVKFMDLSVNDPVSWTWTFEGGTPSTSILRNPVVNYHNPGTFKVSLETRNDFGNNTIVREAYITASAATGIADPDFEELQVYPNPVSDILNIVCDTDFFVKLSDLNGVILFTGKNNKQITVSGFKPGLYILEIKIWNNVFKQKLIKR